MTKHTAGPWNVEKRYHGQKQYETHIENKEASPIFTLLCGTKERDANARLIAAAPELLEALKGLIYCNTLEGGPIEALSKARKAIKKAEGRA